MNAVLQESPKDAARRLAAEAVKGSFRPEALHAYHDASGAPIFWRWRVRCGDGRKVMRPMYWNGCAYVPGEPKPPAEGKPLYRLPDLLGADRDVPVVVVEGELCADALAHLGLVATTSGSATSAKAADWTPLFGRRVLLWPDNDAPGAGYAQDVVAKLSEAGTAVEVLDVSILGLAEHGDCADWLAGRPKAVAADVLALWNTKRATPPKLGPPRLAPEPLRRPVPPAEPYPLDALGPVLADACASLRRVIQAPDAVCGASLLAAASLAVQGLADVTLDGRTYPLSLWLLTVAESGERKSAVDAEAMRAAREVEKELHRAYVEAESMHEAEVEAWEARRDAARSEVRKRKGEGAAELCALGPAPQPPLRPNFIAADFTAEGLSKLLASGRPSVGAFTDEAALVFGGHGMTREAVARTAATLCKLWDRGELDRVRASDGASKLWGRRLALHLLAQPVIAERALADPVLAGQGFLARCLLSWPEGTAGSRSYRAESLRDDAALIRYTERMGEMMRQALPLAHGARNELEPPTLTLTADAFALWERLHNAIEGGMAPGGRYAAAKPWASKAAEQCLRIAGVLAMVESPRSLRIESSTLERAAELALWHLGEAVRLAGTAELSPEVRAAESLLGWCHATGRRLLHSRDALRLGPACIREQEDFRRAMAELELAGWAERIEGGAEIDGARRRHVWRIACKTEA